LTPYVRGATLELVTLRVEWDERKAAQNLAKHGVSFDEAATVFGDDEALLSSDPDHSDDEDRFILLGMSTRPRILVVVHCLRHEGNVLRIISARRGTRREQQQYSQRRPA
jgi:uncharacterized DUF497 family protein